MVNESKLKNVCIFRTNKDCCILQIKKWSTGDKISNITLTNKTSGRAKRLDDQDYHISNIQADSLFVSLAGLLEEVTYECNIDIIDADDNECRCWNQENFIQKVI